MKTLCYGEILWDIIDDKKCLGGAPFNVACHLSRMGSSSYILSAIGQDELGSAALSKINQENVKTDFLKIHSTIPTGTATVFLNNGIPDYKFNYPNAWDNIELTEDQKNSILATDWDIFCFGTLAQRSKISRLTLNSILPLINAKIRFFDVNFRKDFFNREILQNCLDYTDILKMNDEELPVFAKIFDLIPDSFSQDEFLQQEKLCFKICNQFNLKGIILTCGKNGAHGFFDGQHYCAIPAKVTVVDTVGAGDSLSAAFLNEYSKSGDVQKALEAGSKMADFIVQHAGALPEY